MFWRRKPKEKDLYYQLSMAIITRRHILDIESIDGGFINYEEKTINSLYQEIAILREKLGDPFVEEIVKLKKGCFELKYAPKGCVLVKFSDRHIEQASLCENILKTSRSESNDTIMATYYKN